MKSKWVGYSLLGLFIVFAGIYWKFSAQHLSAQNQAVLTVEAREIVASAIIDSVNDIIHIPTLQQGIIKDIDVTLGQKVKKGDALFKIESLFAESGVKINKIALKQSLNGLRIQEKILTHLETQLQRLNSIDKRAISRTELREKSHEINMATMTLKQLQHNYELSLANLKNAEIVLSQFITVAPKDGIVLQINGQLDEFAGGGQQIIFLGDDKKVMVRVSIDERDVHEFSPKGTTYLTHTDYPGLKIPLTFIRLNQYIVVQERLNSRVQEALYYFDRNAYPGFVAGQQFDAHISINKV